MAQDETVGLLQRVLMQMEAQQQALVSLTAVLDKYLSVPLKVDAINSPISLKDGSAIGINNKPTVAAEQTGNWSVDVKNATTRSRQSWEATILIGPTQLTDEVLPNFIKQCNSLGADGWELVNITGYPLISAGFRRPR